MLLSPRPRRYTARGSGRLIRPAAPQPGRAAAPPRLGRRRTIGNYRPARGAQPGPPPPPAHTAGHAQCGLGAPAPHAGPGFARGARKGRQRQGAEPEVLALSERAYL